MPRYAGLLATSLRVSLATAAQYRSDFVLDGLFSIGWALLGIVPLYAALHGRGTVRGWTYEEALVVVGWFTMLSGVLEGAVTPSLLAVVEHIRKGTLDFVLLKPADAQFLVSTSRFEVWKASSVLVGAAVIAWALSRIGSAPGLFGIVAALLLFVNAILVLYTLWILAISASFWVVRVDNLAYLFKSTFDFARWPVSVFRGFARAVFTFVIPLGLMTTYPAEALLGRLDPQTLVFALVGGVAFSALGRLVFLRALAHYSSASS